MKYTFQIKPVSKILAEKGLTPGGRAMLAGANELLKLSAKRIPMDSGALQSSGRVENGGQTIYYPGPYARNMYEGIVMVDPKTKAAGFRTANGWYSRKGVKKIPSGREYDYSGGPTRGARWVQRAWEEEGQKVIQAMERALK